MTTPPDFGGREIEEGLYEDLGGRGDVFGESPQDDLEVKEAVWGDNEAHAPGQTCEICGAVIQPGQDVRRRADGQWMHEVCP